MEPPLVVQWLEWMTRKGCVARLRQVLLGVVDGAAEAPVVRRLLRRGLDILDELVRRGDCDLAEMCDNSHQSTGLIQRYLLLMYYSTQKSGDVLLKHKITRQTQRLAPDACSQRNLSEACKEGVV